MTEKHTADQNIQNTKPLDKFVQPTSEADIERMTPVISVDRAVAHAGDWALPLDEIREFYYGEFQDRPEKPDLNQARIHVSAGRKKDARRNGKGNITEGHLFYNGLLDHKERSAVPELYQTNHKFTPGEHTIFLYTGGALLPDSKDEEPAKIDSAEASKKFTAQLTHELTHLAQLRKGDKYRKPTILEWAKMLGQRATQSIIKRPGDVVLDSLIPGSAAAYFLEKGANPGVIVPLAAGLAASAFWLSGLLDREENKVSNYLNDEREMDARSHEDPDAGLVKIIPNEDINRPEGYEAKSLHKNTSFTMSPSRFFANKRHKKLSATPRSYK